MTDDELRPGTDELLDDTDDTNDTDEIDEIDETDDAPLPARVSNAAAEPPETIGSLIFVATGEYPYPFKVAKPPRFWMEEQTGVLSEAVETYMDGGKLSAAQLDVIKIYLKQYVERAMLAGGPKVALLHTKIDKIKTTADVERFADEVAEYGAEVF